MTGEPRGPGGGGPVEPRVLIERLEALVPSGRDPGDAVVAPLLAGKLPVDLEYRLARALEALGRTAEARDSLGRVVRRDPGYADAKERLGKLIRGGGRGIFPIFDPKDLMGGFSGRYRKIELVGKGGQGLVFKAFDPERGLEVALKVLSPHMVDEPQAVERFLREAKVLSQLESPYVVKVYEAGEKPVLHYAMELMTGETLEGKLKREGAMPLSAFLEFAEQLLEGLAAVHQAGIIHRDLKPENVFLTRDGGAKLGDFGLAGSAALLKITQTGQIFGTLGFMSPEQLEGKAVDERSDLYSMGLIFYQCLAGAAALKVKVKPGGAVERALRQPLEAATSRPLPRRLLDLIERMTRTDPSERPRSARSVLERIRNFRWRLRRGAGSATFAEAATLRHRTLLPLRTMLEDLAMTTAPELASSLADVARAHELKVRVWDLCTRLSDLVKLGPADGMALDWLPEGERLGAALARFVQERELPAMPSLVRRLRDLDRVVENELAPGDLKLGRKFLEASLPERNAPVRLEVPDVPPVGYGHRDAYRIRTLLTGILQQLLSRLEPVPGGRLGLKLSSEDGDEGWALDLTGVASFEPAAETLLDLEALGAIRVRLDKGAVRFRFPLVLTDG